MKKREKFEVYDFSHSTTGVQTTVEAFLSAGTYLLIVTSVQKETIGVRAYCKIDSVSINEADNTTVSADDLWKIGMKDMIVTSFKGKEFGEICEGGREALYYRQQFDQGGFHVEMFKNPTSRELSVEKDIELIDNIRITVLEDENFDPNNQKSMKFTLPGNGLRVVIYEYIGPRPNIEFLHTKLA